MRLLHNQIGMVSHIHTHSDTRLCHVNANVWACVCPCSCFWVTVRDMRLRSRLWKNRTCMGWLPITKHKHFPPLHLLSVYLILPLFLFFFHVHLPTGENPLQHIRVNPKSSVCLLHITHLPCEHYFSWRWVGGQRDNGKRQSGWQTDMEVHSVSQTDKMLEKQAIQLMGKNR